MSLKVTLHLFGLVEQHLALTSIMGATLMKNAEAVTILQFLCLIIRYEGFLD